MNFPGRLFALLATALTFVSPASAQLQLATFDADATPPPGSLLMYDPLKETGELTLRCRGVVLLGAAEPIVLCSVDWIGIANEGHDAFRDALAAAAGTSRSRVALHALHQHDAPICDFTSEKVLRSRGIAPGVFDSAMVMPAIRRAADAVRTAILHARPVTHVGWGRGEVKEVASNRRILGTNGKVRAVRFTACPDPALRAEPEGTIDPTVTMVSFWNGDQPLVALTYYATHPQSYYRTGIANPDFPGIARFLRDQAVPGVFHVHFNGAGGNIGAGKYNDGAKTNRLVLARKLAEGMERAWNATRRTEIRASDVGWEVESASLPLAPHLDRSRIEPQLAGKTPMLYTAAAKLAWMSRRESGVKIEVAALRLGGTRILHMPGELFVEYQLAARQMRPDLNVAMAAYGDYGPWYIGTAVAYDQGGYETAPNSSLVAPEVEGVLMNAMRHLLKD